MTMHYTNAELVRFARRLIEKYGDGAADQAERHANELLASGDADGHAVWMRAQRLIRDLARAAA